MALGSKWACGQHDHEVNMAMGPMTAMRTIWLLVSVGPNECMAKGSVWGRAQYGHEHSVGSASPYSQHGNKNSMVTEIIWAEAPCGVNVAMGRCDCGVSVAMGVPKPWPWGQHRQGTAWLWSHHGWHHHSEAL